MRTSWVLSSCLLSVLACSEAPTGDLDAGAGAPDATQPEPDGGTEPDAGSEPDAGFEDVGPGPCTNDPDCASCAADGECCSFSINCQPGSICNSSFDDYYDPSEPEGVCIRVVCDSDVDCDPGEQCTLEGLCRDRICWADSDCMAGQRCIGGACAAPPSPAAASSCEVVRHRWVLTPGQEVPLEAVVRDTNGQPLRVAPTWASSLDGAAQAGAGTAIAGTTAGTANLTAALTGGAACQGSVTVHNLGALPPQTTRVTAQWADNGDPVVAAPITVIAGAGVATPLVTDLEGVARFDSQAAVLSVTVEAEPNFVSILSPGTRDLVVQVPRPGWADAGGVRGMVDASAVPRADMWMGMVGPGQPGDLLDFGRRQLMGQDKFTTRIDAPELGIEEDVVMPGGQLFGLTNNIFTADAQRCGPLTPSGREVGCYLFTVPRDASSVWTLVGQLKLSEVTGIANELSSGVDEEGAPRGLASLVGLTRRMYHGVDPYVRVGAAPRVPNDPSVDCTDPLVANYLDVCRPDYNAYPAHELAATHHLSVFTVVDVPTLPVVSPTECARYASVAIVSDLGARGLVPLGIGGAPDAAIEGEPADCRVAGANAPFGDGSQPLNDGQIGVALAPPHAGLEGYPRRVVLTASPMREALPVRSVLVAPVGEVPASISIAGTFPEPPTATFDLPNRQVDLGLEAAADFVRIEVYQSRRRWVVLAPAAATVSLPDVLMVQGVLQNMNAAVVFSLRGSDYGRTWVADDPLRLTPNATIDGFASRRVVP